MNTGNQKALERFSLTGKVAFIAGGGGYLGLEISKGLAQHGAKVIIGDVRAGAAQKAASVLAEEGLSAEAMEFNIADEPCVQKAAQDLAARYGAVDIAINATAHSTGKELEQMSLKDWKIGMGVSLDGAFLFSREFGKVMAQNGAGSIIQFSSMYGIVSPDPSIYAPNFTVSPIDYGVAKAGILQMVRYQAVMLGKKGVRVNAIVPGPFPNPTGQGGDGGFVEKLSSKVPMGRVGKAKEIVGAVIFLASDASSFVNGTQIVVDGGWTAW